MDSLRVAPLCFVVALVLAPLPAHAQGPPSGGGGSLNLTELAARVTALEANLAAERAARMAADTTLQTNINNEVNNRVGAVAAEISARQAADTTLQNNITAEFIDRVGAVAQEISDRQAADTTLQGQIDKLKGNITAADLEGTYNFYFVATAIDSGPNTITSYFFTGTVTLGSGGTGQSTISASGTQLTEQAPNLNWVATNVGFGAQVGNFSWAYSNGRVTINAGGDINDFTPAAGGQVMVGVQGGPPGNNQAIIVLTRQPSI
jgi:hypothetical protein